MNKNNTTATLCHSGEERRRISRCRGVWQYTPTVQGRDSSFPMVSQNDRFQQNVAVMLNNLIQSTELIQQMFIFIYCFTWERYINKNESLIKGMTIPNMVIIYPDHPVILSKK